MKLVGGHLFVMSWGRVRRAALGSVVRELCTVSGMVFVTLLVLSVVEVCVDYGGINVFHVCHDFCVGYGVGVCINVCGVVCVVVCCLFLTSGGCLLCRGVL